MLTLLASFLLSNPSMDPRLVGASREDGAGWIQLHLKGKPRDIGYQYGTLLAAEIDDAQRAQRSEISGKYDWDWYRVTAKKLFWSKVDPEYQQEMEGQAEGLKAKGYNIDVWDVLAYNANIEIGGYYIPTLREKETGVRQSGAKESCSAFVATGSYTKDGRPVLGHNLWWSYLMGERANVILDIQPEKGEPFKMDAFCGMIHSGTDYAINAAGIGFCETTISGFAGFDPSGIPEFVRMRKAIQYSKSLDDVARIFKTGNNGGYANTWLIVDLNANTIGKLELGLKNVNLATTADGYYVGSNFPENPKLIAQEIPGGWDADPKSNGCEARRLRWNTLLTENRGKIDAELGKAFLADTYDQTTGKKGGNDNTLCGKGEFGGATNTKVADGGLLSKQSFWARMGVSDGSEKHFASKGGFLHDIKSQPWILVK
ncbi:C45 family autoproteolytic acyltransferase/hydolase [Fimbriimonas ginsengisoli]|uniref:Peptidase C45, acyl-coenzyme A:6-aminopenicillanic acid acyl-transferase n=1 Tax=Fimbriimonas ginsengisoli Gsoil 348 TaxID=661478 RepID=A0A068NU68_FIMGI|nr:C45 family peptidase [Fimbriimonas ginsengisoli]AIE85144.1 peptidase C45, acyl-coenzyme A:6-aminopenicillanic acid acyl-transferase [Fimbriimonas ginsengisoli Gsoil 348]